MGKAELRVERMAAARVRIQKKIDAGHPKSAEYQARLADYDAMAAEDALQAQLDEMRAKRQGDVSVSPGTASLAGGGE